MHVTIHLTTGCNMRCDYCYSPPVHRSDMSEEVVLRAVDYAASLSPSNTGIIFFGGEPLLRKDLIRAAIARAQELDQEYGFKFHYKVTTNGLLLDASFLEYASKVGLLLALSVDGVRKAHDRHRRTLSGEGTFDRLEPKVDLLLKYQPYASALMLVSPETVACYAESVAYLYHRGFRYLIASLNYAGAWTNEAIEELKHQYQFLSRWYERLTLDQEKVYFSPFEVKLATHIQGEDALCQRCHLGMRQVSVAPDGTIYPCVQFVKDGESNKGFGIGDVWQGIDESKRGRLFQLSQKRDEACRSCALLSRCNCHCSCLNWQTTGEVNGVSPFLCEHERMLVPLVDRLGERLFRKRAPMFIQKHYNAVYPILSLLEDTASL